VRDDHRHAQLGTRLVVAAEEEAAARGCELMRVNTHTFQAPDFYARLGYQQFGAVAGTPRGHGEVFLVKRIGDAAAGPTHS
jgi:predicted N-acetyltransferase YhbS